MGTLLSIACYSLFNLCSIRYIIVHPSYSVNSTDTQRVVPSTSLVCFFWSAKLNCDVFCVCFCRRCKNHLGVQPCRLSCCGKIEWPQSEGDESNQLVHAWLCCVIVRRRINPLTSQSQVRTIYMLHAGRRRFFSSFVLSFALSVTPSFWHHLFFFLSACGGLPFPLPVCRLGYARCLSDLFPGCIDSIFRLIYAVRPWPCKLQYLLWASKKNQFIEGNRLPGGAFWLFFSKIN